MSEQKETRRPYPGSRDAIEAGCRCPVVDNHYGKGRYDDYTTFVVNADCPLHGENLKPSEK